MKTPALLSLVLATALTSCVVEVPESTTTKPSHASSAASGEVNHRVIADCRAALRKTFPTQKMKVISARKGENSYIVDFKVEGAQKPWRCYHDGTRCTGTEYQGEG